MNKNSKNCTQNPEILKILEICHKLETLKIRNEFFVHFCDKTGVAAAAVPVSLCHKNSVTKYLRNGLTAVKMSKWRV